MSWAGYVDNLEKGKGQCKFAAILGKNDASSPMAVWAESSDKSAFGVSQPELLEAARKLFEQDASLRTNGLKLGGVGFFCIILEPDLLVCQGKQECKDYSLVLATSSKCCIVGFNPTAEVKTAQVREAVETIRDYLKNASY